MKKFIVCALIAVSALSVTITSCSKYPDGPKITLLTAKSRVSGDWKIEEVLDNGNDITNSSISILGSNFVWSIVKDGTYTQTGNFTDHGTWVFNSDKTALIQTPSSSSSTTYTILKLKSKSLWLKDGSTEWHLKQ